jgi:hypothetical protein
LQSWQTDLRIAKPLQASQVAVGIPAVKGPTRPLPLQVAHSVSTCLRPLQVPQIVQSLQPLKPSRQGLPVQTGQLMMPVWLQPGQPTFLKAALAQALRALDEGCCRPRRASASR